MLKYGLGNGKLYHGLAFALLIMFVLQYATGAVLSCMVIYSISGSFETLKAHATESWYG